MREISFEQVLLLLVLILWPLLTFIVQRFRRRLEEEKPAEKPSARMPERARPVAPRPSPARAARERVRHSEPPVIVAPIERHRVDRRRLLLGTPRDLRQAIILMTVLGPCRALGREDATSPQSLMKSS